MSANEPNHETKCMNCTIKIHFGYIISILVAVIIVLLSVKWAEIQNLSNYLNFALGVTSLVLAVVAIVYAFFANNSFNETVSKLETAATNIKEETGDLEKAVRGLELKLKEIPEALHLLEGQVAKTHSLVVASSQQPQAPVPNQDHIEQFANNSIDYFLNVSSWNGLKVMHLCHLACKNEKEFDLKEWTTLDPTISYDYAYGYLIAASSIGFFNHVMDGSKVHVTTMSQLFAQKILPAIEARIKNFPVPHNKDFPPQIEIIQKFIG